MSEQPKTIAAHDRLIQSARLAANREIELDYLASRQDSIANLKEGSQTLIEDGVVAHVKDGKISFTRTGLALQIFDALVDERAMVLLFKQRATAGQAILKLMWEFFQKQKITLRGEAGEEYNPDELVKYANKTFGTLMDDNQNYAGQLAFVVLRVLQPVYAAQLQRKPFINENGQAITVEDLIDGKKMLGKLIDMSYTFENATPDQKGELLNAATTGTQAKVKEVKNSINGVGPITGTWVVHSAPEGKYKVEMDGLTEEQIQFIEKALGSGWVCELR